MPHSPPPYIHGVSSLTAKPVAQGSSQWLEITAHGPDGEPVQVAVFFRPSATTAAHIAALAAAINAVPLVMVAQPEKEAA